MHLQHCYAAFAELQVGIIQLKNQFHYSNLLHHWNTETFKILYLKVFLVFLTKTENLIMHFYHSGCIVDNCNHHTEWSKKLEIAFWLLNSALQISLKTSNSGLGMIQDELTKDKTESGKRFESGVVRTDGSRICTNKLHSRKERGWNVLKCMDENLPHSSKQWRVLGSPFCLLCYLMAQNQLKTGTPSICLIDAKEHCRPSFL